MNHDPSPSPDPSYLERLKYLGSFVLLLWLIEIADRLFFQSSLEHHGIHPRSFSHLEGLIFAPFLHDGWGHLIGNSISLLILGAAILAGGWRKLAHVSIAAAIAAGVLVWIIGGGDTNHIGASSIVFGYLGFLVAAGFYQRTPATIIISILIVIFYGGSFFGIFPNQPGVSWESHLGGAIGGLLVARQNRVKLRSSPELGDY